MKICSKCARNSNETTFAADKKSKDGLRSSCKECHKKLMKAYNQKNSENNRVKQKLRDATRPRGSRHKISEKQYLEMLYLFNGNCWACKENAATQIDHDHECCPGTYSCGKCVRGLLCRSCNLALGMLEDSVLRAQGLVKYLQLGVDTA